MSIADQMLTAACLVPADQIEQITGYRQAAKQVAELQRQGFWRARRNVMGVVVLERSHYDAVCAGQDKAPPAPKLRAPTLRTA